MGHEVRQQPAQTRREHHHPRTARRRQPMEERDVRLHPAGSSDGRMTVLTDPSTGLPMTRRSGLPFQGKRSSYWATEGATEGAALGYDGTAFQAGLSTSCPSKQSRAA